MSGKVSQEDFVVAWATAVTIADVIRDTGLKKDGVNSRAYLLRRKGVNLPKLQRTSKPDLDKLRVSQLNELIKKHNRSDR